MAMLMHCLKPFAPMFFPEGTIHTIFRGPCRGMRYRIFTGYGWAPLYGGWEVEAQNIIRRHLSIGSVVYDVGANYGIHTFLMARQVGSSGQVFAFEPVPPIASALQENIALNNLAQVTIVRQALSDRIGAEHFYRADHDGAGHLESTGIQSGEKIEVETTTLDEFVIHQNHRPPTLIKMDIEGAEGRALAGGQLVIHKFRPMILVDLHSPAQDQTVGEILLEAGYHAVRTGDGMVPDLRKPWPAKDGIWGQVFAWPKESRVSYTAPSPFQRFLTEIL